MATQPLGTSVLSPSSSASTSTTSTEVPIQNPQNDFTTSTIESSHCPTSLALINHFFSSALELIQQFFAKIFCCFTSSDNPLPPENNPPPAPPSIPPVSTIPVPPSGSTPSVSTTPVPPPVSAEPLLEEYEFQIGTARITLTRGDLLAQWKEPDPQNRLRAIVNAANTGCIQGGGIDHTIGAAGGPALLAARKALPEISPGIRCLTGSAAITISGNLSSRNIDHVIHAVGPIYKKDDPEIEKQLIGAYEKSLQLALENGIKQIAFPLISGGIFQYPTELASVVGMQTIKNFCEKNPDAFDEVKLVIIEKAKFEKAYAAIKQQGIAFT